MLRTLLASPWVPLLYWTAAVLSALFSVRQASFNPATGTGELQSVVGIAVPGSVIQDQPSRTDARSSRQAIASAGKSTPLWYPLISVLQIPDPFVQEFALDIAARRKNSDPIEADPSIRVPATMLSIRADRPGQQSPETLAIRCRTDIAIRPLDGNTIPIQGVVTQEVVSSGGKILIMAGSRVTGSGQLDPENGRIKSDGLWSVFFDENELQVRARLLDRPGGLPGLLGTDLSLDNAALQKKIVRPAGSLVSVARNSPFVLELHGEMLLRNIKSVESTN